MRADLTEKTEVVTALRQQIASQAATQADKMKAFREQYTAKASGEQKEQRVQMLRRQIRDYEQRLKDIDAGTRRVDDTKEEVDSKQAGLDELTAEWKPALERMISTVNDNFSSYFQRTGASAVIAAEMATSFAAIIRQRSSTWRMAT